MSSPAPRRPASLSSGTGRGAGTGRPGPASRAGAGSLVAGVLGLLVALALVVGVGAVPAVAQVSHGLSGGLGAFAALPGDLAIQPPAQVSTVYAKRGGQDVPIASFYAQNRQNVSWEDIADTVKTAAVDTEDPRFYSEGAIDVLGTIRGAFSTISGKDVQGGSSITQQYVKNVLVERCTSLPDATQVSDCYQQVTAITVARKVREMRYAVGLEQQYSKQQILRGYLNIVGFGGNVYGVQAAGLYYFGTPARDLSLTQAATLVAILNNPANLRIDQPQSTTNGAANGYALTKARRDYVLQRMADHHDLSDADLQAAQAQPIQPAITPLASGCSQANAVNAGFYCSYVQHVIQNDDAFGKTYADRAKTLNAGGLKIYTPLDLDLQATAQQSLSKYIPATRSGIDLGASNVSVEPGTGRIITMVQNRGFNDSNAAPADQTSVNYSTDHAFGGSNGFQTGSAFKAFTLAEWLSTGHSLNARVPAYQHVFPRSEFTNSCMDIAGPAYSVTNDEGAASSLTVLQATAESVNTAFVNMATKLDLCKILKTAESMGVHAASSTNPLTSNPSMVLGTNYISPLTMATAYAGFANKGVWCTPVAIDRIVGPNGQDLPESKTTCTQGVTPQVAAGVIRGLTGVLEYGGTAALANPRDDVPIFGKTGTTDRSLENWLVTSTTKIATATWVGNISGSTSLRSLYFDGVWGGNVKFSVAKPILAALDARYGGDDFPDPPDSMLRYTYNDFRGSYSPPTSRPTRTAAPSPTSTPTPPPTSTPLPTTPEEPTQAPVPGDGSDGATGKPTPTPPGQDGRGGGPGTGGPGTGQGGPGVGGTGSGGTGRGGTGADGP